MAFKWLHLAQHVCLAPDCPIKCAKLYDICVGFVFLPRALTLALDDGEQSVILDTSLACARLISCDRVLVHAQGACVWGGVGGAGCVRGHSHQLMRSFLNICCR